MIVILRCQTCMKERKTFDYSSSYVFIASTLKAWAETTCEECGNQGLELCVMEKLEGTGKEQGVRIPPGHSVSSALNRKV